MTLQNLSALLPSLGPQASPGVNGAGPGAIKEAGGWAEILRGFEQFAGAAQQDPGLAQQGWLESLEELKARLGQTEVPPDLAAQFQNLFSWLESQLPTDESALNLAQATQALPPYEGAFWPDSGALILLLQGISPWGDSLSPEQSAWIEQVGPFLGIPELSRSYQGPTELGREMTAVNLADRAGGDVQRAFVDAWLGRHDAQGSRASYEHRWAAGAGVPSQPAPASAAMARAAEAWPFFSDTSISGREPLLDPGRFGALPGVLNNGLMLDQRENSSGLVRADAAPVQAPTPAAVRDFGPLLGSLAASQPQSASAELRAAAEQTMERVVWMAARKQGLSEARLQLHPAHLGKLDIRLELQGREASLQLTVYHSAVREAVEAMLPRLKEQLEGQGLNLGDAWVFDSGAEEKGQGETARLAGRGTEAPGAEGDLADAESVARPPRRGDGLLDAYA